MLLAPRDGARTRMLVLVARDKAGKASLAGFAESSGSIGTPDLVVDNDKRRLVHVGGTLAGSGGGNADALFVSDTATAKWRRVDLSDRSEEHTSELQSLMRISYAVLFLNKTNIL